jgi:uncharacterized membrane protein
MSANDPRAAGRSTNINCGKFEIDQQSSVIFRITGRDGDEQIRLNATMDGQEISIKNDRCTLWRDVMRAIKLCLSALILSCAISIMGTAAAWSQTFLFKVCNHSDVTASVAVMSHVDTDDDRFMVKGWWTVESGECENIGHFPQGWFYYFAEQTGSGKLYWGGNDLKICIRHPGPWERINRRGYSCRSDEKLKGFIGKSVDTGTYIWNLNP